ncbi:TPA: DNA adenine methylase, partial [Staphylococcus pseudintermedius]
LKKVYNKIKKREYDDTYLEDNYGSRFFSNFDAMRIGEIRERIEKNTEINERERAILITSLLYSLDNIANTVGHYDAYRKNSDICDKFKFELINPINKKDKEFSIFRKDANQLVREVKADVAFIDPPYNSRQYSRFYHVLESITKWDKPILSGVAMKPPVENMSAYSKVVAPKMFDDLISNLNVNYIVVTYNNTYNSKSSSSKNKITHEQILESLKKVGNTRQFEQSYKFFNTGKTDLKNHKEFVFITEVGVFNDNIYERKTKNK